MITIDELTGHINDFGGVTDISEQAANRVFIENVHGILKEGGLWGWPDGDKTYRKTGEGFELIE
jgi:hypothetical protein